MENKSTGYLYKYCPITKNTLEIFINNEIYLSKTNQFNDPFDAQLSPTEFVNEIKELGYTDDVSILAQYESSFNAMMNQYGVYCLSAECDNILMWSHYADAHKGICLGFVKDFDRHIYTDCITWIDPVSYNMEHPFEGIRQDFLSGRRNPIGDFANFADIHSVFSKAFISVKHKNWDYEKEYRVISHVSGLQTFNPKALKSVILGMNISREDEFTIKSLLNNNMWKHVDIFKAKRRTAKLALDIVKI